MIFRRSDAEGVNFLTLDNGKGLRLVVCDQGASIYAVYFNDRIMVATPFSRTTFLEDRTKYWGQTVGPLCLRYKKGRYKVGSFVYHMTPNERGNTLHSSSLNWGKMHFDAKVELGNEYSDAIFSLKTEVHPYQGVSCEIEVVYRVYEKENKFEILYHVTPNHPAFLNPTNHTYWSLGEENILDCKLKLGACHRLRYDKDMLPKKRWKKCKKIFDFSKGKKIGQDIEDPKLQDSTNHGYDHFFFLQDKKVVLESADVRLIAETDREGVQIYTNNYASTDLRLLGKNGAKEVRYNAVTLEFADDCRAVHQPIYLPESPYKAKTSYTFETK